jgi:hypothetical protein
MCTRPAPDPASYAPTARRKRRPRAVDGRTTPARRYAALVTAFTTEIGGALSEAERGLVEQAALLQLRVEQLRADVIAGRSVDDDLIVKIAGASRRALSKIVTRAKPANAMTLAEYAAQRAAAVETDEEDDDGAQDQD